MNYRQQLAREERIQEGLAYSLKYSFNNNMSSIKNVYRYLHGSEKGFDAFWRKHGGSIHYRCVDDYRLYDEQMLLEAFRKEDGFRRFLDRNRITSWEILAYRADENEVRDFIWRSKYRPDSLYYV